MPGPLFEETRSNIPLKTDSSLTWFLLHGFILFFLLFLFRSRQELGDISVVRCQQMSHFINKRLIRWFHFYLRSDVGVTHSFQ